jgi:hypothetical protein
MTEHADSVTRASAMLDTWRARGDDAVLGMRVRVIEALAKRASAYEGEARRVLDAKLSTLLDACAHDVARKKQAQQAAPSAFAPLLDALSEHGATRPAPSVMLDALRAVWSKVSAEKRVRESQALVPKNAGPLNSNSLVHRSLELMRETSPEYLQHFLGYLDALAWMESLTSTLAPPAVAPKKPARRAR